MTASERVDVELVLLADASGSIDVRIQRWLGVRSSGQRSRGAGPAKRRSRSIIPTASLANG